MAEPQPDKRSRRKKIEEAEVQADAADAKQAEADRGLRHQVPGEAAHDREGGLLHVVRSSST